MFVVLTAAVTLLIGTVLGIVIGAHLAATGRLTASRRLDARDAVPAAPTPAAAVAAVLRDHAALTAVLREISAAPATGTGPAVIGLQAHAQPLPAVRRELDGGQDR